MQRRVLLVFANTDKVNKPEFSDAIAEEHLNGTKEKIREARAEKEQIVAERDKEADYSHVLKDAKDGDIAHRNGRQNSPF